MMYCWSADRKSWPTRATAPPTWNLLGLPACGSTSGARSGPGGTTLRNAAPTASGATAAPAQRGEYSVVPHQKPVTVDEQDSRAGGTTDADQQALAGTQRQATGRLVSYEDLCRQRHGRR